MTGKSDSWAVRWCYHLFKTGQLTVYPKESKTLNIGFDSSGTHCSEKDSKLYQNIIMEQQYKIKFEELDVNEILAEAVSLYEKESFERKMKSIIKKYFGR